MNFRSYDHVFWRDGKLYLIVGDGLLVMKPWPPQAWYRRNTRSAWVHCRPNLFDLGLAKPRGNVTVELQRANLHDAAAKFHAGNGEPPTLPDLHAEPKPSRIMHIAEIIQSVAAGGFEDLPAIAGESSRPRLGEREKRRVARALRQYNDWRHFVRQIPAETVEAIRPFPERHFALASYAARCPGALDLLQSTPALALMEANCWVFGKRVQRPLRSCRSLLKKPQRDQLAWLGFQRPSKAAIRILRKLPAPSLTVLNLLYLRDAMNDAETFKTLLHVSRINRGVVRIVSDPELRARAGFALLEEVGQSIPEDATPEIAYRLRDLLHRPEDDLPAQFRSIDDVNRLYRRALERVRRDHYEVSPSREGIRKLDFPPPPFAPTEGLVPIRTPDELIEEGDRQKHCVASYADRVARGLAYVYRIQTRNERATLMLDRDSTDPKAPWRIRECRAARNRDVRPRTMKWIREWLPEFQPNLLVDAEWSRTAKRRVPPVEGPPPPEQLRLDFGPAAAAVRPSAKAV